MTRKTITKVPGRIAGWAKGLLLCALLPCLGVHADPWEPYSGHIHQEYTGPWKWDESNVKTITQGDTTKITCDATITGYTGNKTAITIPEKITMSTSVDGGGISIRLEYEATVTGIGDYAFYNCSGLTGVTIPDSVTSIGGSAFYGCSGLTSVTIGNGVTSIGQSAFSGCSGLTSVHVSDLAAWCRISFYDPYFSHPLYYAHNLYLNGSLVTDLVIPNGVTSIGRYAFSGCSGLTRVTIPDGVTSIGSSAFYDCSGLTSVTIPDSVTSIGDLAFGYCRAIKDVTVPQYVLDRTMSSIFPSYPLITNVAYSGVIKRIGPSAFSGCSGLTSVTIPNSVTNIGQKAFYGCSGLTSVTIPNSVTNIGDTAFSGCSSLRNVYLHDVANVKGIAVWCGIEFGNSQASPFCYAQNLYLNGELVTALEIPDGVTGIGNYAFYNCDSLKSISIPDSVANLGESAFSDCDNITIAAVPQSVMSQGLSTVFYRSYQNLQSLRLGANVSAIGVNEFANCRALTSVTVADGNTSYVVLDDGCLYDMARNLILFCPRNKASVTIPNGVTTIGKYAFQYCTNLVSASMPETVQSIGSASFIGCAKLSGLTIPSSVQTLPTAAFNGCDVLWTEWYRALANLSVNGGGSSSGGNVEPVDPRYALAASPADRAIASVTVDRDCAIDQFVLTDGKVYDTVLRVVNTSASEVHLTLPAGYVYETFKGATPLTIPANSRNMLTITRTTGDTFLVTREELETVQ